MIKASELIANAQSEIEGGLSAKIDWYLALQQAVERLTEEITPETAKKVLPIYGGLTKDLQVYYCPDDVQVPSRLYGANNDWFADFTASQDFYRNGNSKYGFILDYINGVRYIVARIPYSNAGFVFDNMSDIQHRSGVLVSTTEYNALAWANVGVEGVFSDIAYTTTKSSMTLNVADFLKGLLSLPIYIEDASLVSSISVVLRSSTGNYSTLTAKEITNKQLKSGQNFIRIPMSNRVDTGSPDFTAITEYDINVQMTTGKSQNVVFGKVSVQKNYLFNFEYTSYYMYIDKITGLWKDQASLGDWVNINKDLKGILHFTLCEIAEEKIKKPQLTKRGFAPSRFADRLSLAKFNYFKRHPSSEQLISYNVSALEQDDYMGDDVYGDFKEPALGGYGGYSGNGGNFSGGGSSQTSNLGYVDAEDIQSTAGNIINGVASSFTLTKTPINPTSSIVNLSGIILVYGTDYTISGNQLIFTAPLNITYAGQPVTISYVYRSFVQIPQIAVITGEDIQNTGYAGNIIDGANTVFTLKKIPYNPSSTTVDVSGVALTYGVDFTVSGNQLTFTSPLNIVYAGLPVLVSYRYQP